MPIDERLKTFLKRRDIQKPGQSHLEGKVVGRAFRKKVVDKPEPLLCKREWQGVRSFHRAQRDSSAKPVGILEVL
jgi:hypothetical protein